jgi:sugar phosphate isomerase/epimerase
MYKNLNTGAIGVKATLAEQLDLARRHGFAGIDFSISEAQTLAEAQGVDAVKQLFAASGVKPGSWGFPVDYRKDKATWRSGLAALPKQAALAAELGCLRTATWILPGDNEMSFWEYFAFHVDRLRPAAQILKEHGHRFGMEFIGPKTMRDTRKHLFVYTLDGMLALGAAIGTGNMGLLLDIWHLYTSHGSVDDVRKLAATDIVSVHVNDAPAGIEVDQQIDQVRTLPGETGVLPIADFLQALQEIGYDGPVTSEPFSQRVRDLPPEQAVAETTAAMNKIWRQASLEQ